METVIHMVQKDDGKPVSRVVFRTEIALVRTDLAEVESDLQAEITVVRSDLAALKSDLRAEIAGVKSELKGDIAKVSAELIKTRAEMATKSDISLLDQKLNRVINTLDSFVGESSDNKRSFTVQGDMLGKHRMRLDEHETRISALESKP